MKLTECRWCGATHGPQCPSVKAIEYFQDGTVKRVEFKTTADYMSPTYMHPAPWPNPGMPLRPTLDGTFIIS